MNIEALIRKNILALKPYRSARQDNLSGILLDANENAFGSATNVDNLTLNRYPDPFQGTVRKMIGDINDVALENIFIGAGSDEAIDLLTRIFCEPKTDNVVLLEPTYGMYRVSAEIQDIKVKSCLLDKNFQIDVQKVKQTIDDNTKIIFCCSPNNPTANLLNTKDILELCNLNKIIVVDEAYIDFADQKSLGRNVLQIPNLIILRTLSKAWGLAGIRFGYCIADAKIISYLMKVKAPYNINILTSKTAYKALSNINEVKKMIELIKTERSWLINEMRNFSFIHNIYKSDANFVLIKCNDAEKLCNHLLSKGIVVRNRSNEPMLDNCVRITIGTHKENEALINAMQEYL